MEINKVRLNNFRLINAKMHVYGTSTAKSFLSYLQDYGVLINGDKIGRFYREEEFINEEIASDIEKKLSLPVGWMSTDHSFFYELSADESELLVDIRKLSGEIVLSIKNLIKAIVKQEA